MKTSELIKSHFFIHFLFILLYSTQNNSRKKKQELHFIKNSGKTQQISKLYMRSLQFHINNAI